MSAVILPASTFQNGQPLDPSELNKALYDTKFPTAPGESGVYSAGNGGLNVSNFSPTFTLQQEHVQPGQVVRAKASGAWSTLDNMSDVTGRTTTSDNVRIPKAQALPGCGVRVYAPFDAKAIRWNVSLFWYVARWWGLDLSAEPVSDMAKDITVHLFVDGVRKRGFKRIFPLTWFKKKADATTPQGEPYSLEAEQAAHWNLSFLQTIADEDNPNETLTKGWHEVYLGFYVRPVDDELALTSVQKYDRQGTVASATADIHQRLSIGCRSARVVAFR